MMDEKGKQNIESQNIAKFDSSKPLFVEIPGYFIEAEIDIPNYHPHTLWRLAYISEILKGKTILEIKNNPPWPVPRDDLIINQIINELIDNGWLIPSWEKNEFKIGEEIRELYNKGGEIALSHHLFSYITIKGEWWIDGVSGTVLPRLTALHFDVDFSKKEPTNLIKIENIENFNLLIEEKNFNIIDLINALDEKIEFQFPQFDRAYISSSIKITGEKNIRFKMLEDYNESSEKLIPIELAPLEAMLYEYEPRIFGERNYKKKKSVKWKSSSIEKFALILEKFPENIQLITSKKFLLNQTKLLLEKLSSKDEWINWYKNGQILEPLIGEANQFFDALAEIIEGKEILIENAINESPPSHLLLSTSFLNSNNLEENAGLIEAIKSNKCKILLLYGHSNDETLQDQLSTIDEYKKRIRELNPAILNHLTIVTAKKRSHEKILISSKADWIIGSWNVGSSKPDSKQFEAGIKGKNKQFALKILERIAELVEDKIGVNFIDELRTQISDLKNVDDTVDAEKFYAIIRKITFYLFSIISKDETDKETEILYEKTLKTLRLLLLAVLKKSQVELINEHQSRDIIITQIKKSNQDIFLASDRVNSSALDSTILNDIYYSETGTKKYLRILWGREWEKEESISKDSRTQLKDARNTIRSAQKILGNQLLTELTPMENHAKFALFDGVRGLITSENILSYGGEKNKYESRELGVFIEGIPIVRYLHGKAMLHRLKYFNPKKHFSDISYRPYEWIIEAIEQYYALISVSKEIKIDYSNIAIIQSAIEKDLDDLESLDDFDKEMHMIKKSSFEERKKIINQDFISYLWNEGTKYYLIHSFDKSRWLPFQENYSIDKYEKIVLKEIPDIENAIEENILNEKKKEVERISHKTDSSIIEEIMNEMVLIKNGSFLMGNKLQGEEPIHKVIISEDFYMSKYVVTQELWRKVMGNLPYMSEKFISSKNPIIHVSYNDAQEFLKKLNSLPNSGGFDLPTEAQWEYACRAGTQTEYYFGNNPGNGSNPSILEEFAWTKRNSEGKLHQVGMKKPNNWGLFDMHGLVYESLKDDLRVFSNQITKDPLGPLDTEYVCYKGGAWTRFPLDKYGNKKFEHFRCSFRDHHLKSEKSYRTGFRLMRKCSQ